MKHVIRKKFSPVIVMLVAVLMVLSGATSSLAQRPLNVGYFSGYDYSNSTQPLARASTLVMIQNGSTQGLPASAYASKAGFEDFIVSNLGDGNFNTGSIRTKQNKVGAAFIIQTMRGGTDYTAPSYAQIADWQTRINNNSVSFTLQLISYTLDTGIAYRRPNGGRMMNDAAQFNIPTMSNQTALVFGFPGGSYSIRIACANPVGDLGNGIPNIPTDYNLNPDISANRTSGEAGIAVQVSPTVTNSGHAASGNSQWQLSQFVVPPGGSYPGAGASPSAPAVYYGNTLIRLSGGSGVSFPVGGPNPIGQSSQTVPDYPVGTKICYALSVQARSDTDGQWAHSAPACVVIAKKPQFQVHGGDIRAGSNFADQSVGLASNITTSQTIKNRLGSTNRIYGSWGEYAVTATGIITGIGSGSAFSGPGLANASACSYTFLTVSNATNSNCKSTPATSYGKYSMGRTIPNVVANFPISSAGSTLSGTVGLSGLSGTYKTSGTLVINGGTLEKGHIVVINTYNSITKKYQDVTIAGDIKYTTDTLTSSDQIPQLVILAKNINIQSGVRQVDAWLSAEGTLNTCSDISRTSITINNCNKALTINGPVMANQVQLWRTAGSDSSAASGDPAEVFNQRPDAYLWGISNSARSGRLETVYTHELPPRF